MNEVPKPYLKEDLLSHADDETQGFVVDREIAEIGAVGQDIKRDEIIRYEETRKKIFEDEGRGEDYFSFNKDLNRAGDDWDTALLMQKEVFKRAMAGLRIENPDATEIELEIVASQIAEDFTIRHSTLRTIKEARDKTVG